MRKDELHRILITNNVPKDLYKLDSGFPNEAFCLNEENYKWEVYYSERGSKSQLTKFHSEEEACDYFHKLIIWFIQ